MPWVWHLPALPDTRCQSRPWGPPCPAEWPRSLKPLSPCCSSCSREVPPSAPQQPQPRAQVHTPTAYHLWGRCQSLALVEVGASVPPMKWREDSPPRSGVFSGGHTMWPLRRTSGFMSHKLRDVVLVSSSQPGAEMLPVVLRCLGTSSSRPGCLPASVAIVETAPSLPPPGSARLGGTACARVSTLVPTHALALGWMRCSR